MKFLLLLFSELLKRLKKICLFRTSEMGGENKICFSEPLKRVEKIKHGFQNL
jgi:hypothetical protein